MSSTLNSIPAQLDLLACLEWIACDNFMSDIRSPNSLCIGVAVCFVLT